MGSSPQRGPDSLILTLREKEIALLVALGYPNRMIAGLLCISEKTVRNHMTHILRKTCLSRRAALASLVWQIGWMDAMVSKKG